MKHYELHEGDIVDGDYPLSQIRHDLIEIKNFVVCDDIRAESDCRERNLKRPELKAHVMSLK
jgi:hypothetical protein